MTVLRNFQGMWFMSYSNTSPRPFLPLLSRLVRVFSCANTQTASLITPCRGVFSCSLCLLSGSSWNRLAWPVCSYPPSLLPISWTYSPSFISPGCVWLHVRETSLQWLNKVRGFFFFPKQAVRKDVLRGCSSSSFCFSAFLLCHACCIAFSLVLTDGWWTVRPRVYIPGQKMGNGQRQKTCAGWMVSLY